MKFRKSKLQDFDKYKYYLDSVQSPESDVEFLTRIYKEIRKKEARVLREDFCGTFTISCEWVKLNKKNTAIGVDLDEEPITYGKANYLSKLSTEQQERVDVLLNNVLDPSLPEADIIDAQNFSYFLFKKRAELKSYIWNVHKTLKKDGIFVMDCFGGSQCQEPNEEETEHEDFSYFWDQDSFDPVTNEAQFYIHFKRKGEKKKDKVFSYDWRMWSIPEIKDIMEEVGFDSVKIYWEGTDKDGEGDGEFTAVDKGEDCESWVAYIVGVK